jgi:hypothetical protein
MVKKLNSTAFLCQWDRMSRNKEIIEVYSISEM